MLHAFKTDMDLLKEDSKPFYWFVILVLFIIPFGVVFGTVNLIQMLIHVI